ncbi:hypothetical protein, partial [Salmonella sp. s51228]|uniref:hypothetical protein n=1 Tax=Salmonella sp. s51228 TaxID=3159652 RepID=UPI00397F0372
DAEESDSYRFAQLQALITETGVRISFVLTGSCKSRRRRSLNDQFGEQRFRNRKQSIENLYSIIATFSGGQVLNVQPDEISELASLIFLSSERSFTQILLRTGTGSITTTVYFPVDITIIILIISLNGVSISYMVRTP